MNKHLCRYRNCIIDLILKFNQGEIFQLFVRKIKDIVKWLCDLSFKKFENVQFF